MKIEEAIKLVNLLHGAYPSDKKATAQDLAQRAESYNVALADYDFETVKRAAQNCIANSKFYPTTSELIDEVKRIYLTTTPASVTPITEAEPVDDPEVEAYLEAFCEWIGFGCEANDDAILPKGVLRYEE